MIYKMIEVGHRQYGRCYADIQFILDLKIFLNSALLFWAEKSYLFDLRFYRCHLSLRIVRNPFKKQNIRLPGNCNDISLWWGNSPTTISFIKENKRL